MSPDYESDMVMQAWYYRQRNKHGYLVQRHLLETTEVFHYYCLYTLKKDFIYLFLEREEGKEKRGRETSIDCLLHDANRGPSPQPRHVP